MSTTIRDLLDAVHEHLTADALTATGAATNTAADPAVGPAVGPAVEPVPVRTPQAARTALSTIAAAASILSRLRLDGVDRTIGGPREHAVTALASACTAVQRACDPHDQGRAAQLLGAAGDAIGRFRDDAAVADRWALALAVADVVRHATSLYRDHGPEAPNFHVGWARGAAATLTRVGAQHPPEPRQVMLWDRRIPSAESPDASPLAVAAHGMDNLTDTLRRSTHPHTADVSVAELRVIATAALVAARYISAIYTVANGQPQREVVEEWIGVRRALAAIHDGLTPAQSSDQRIFHWATRVPDGLYRTLGPADQMTRHKAARLTDGDMARLVDIARQLPVTADLLQTSVHRDTPLYARATDLALTEPRVEARLRGGVVPLDEIDYEHFGARLHRAATASVQALTQLRNTKLPPPSTPAASHVDIDGDRLRRPSSAVGAVPSSRLNLRAQPVDVSR